MSTPMIAFGSIESALRQRIASRLSLLALVCLGAALVWLAVMTFSGEVSAGAAFRLLVAQAAILVVAGVLGRADRSRSWALLIALGACVLVGNSWVIFFAATAGSGPLLASVMLFLYVHAALLLTWGWKPELALILCTVPAWLAAMPYFSVRLASAQRLTVCAVGVTIALAVAQWSARAFREDARRRLEQEALTREIAASRETLRLLGQHEALVREEERKRLGLDLHDGVCQELVGVSMLIESVRQRLGQVPQAIDGDLERIQRHVSEVAEHLRLLAREIRPVMLRELGLEGSLRSLAATMSSPARPVTAAVTTPIPRLEEGVELAVYRIAQEALGNAIRHARARSVGLMLEARSGRLLLEVRDNGCGFDPAGRRSDTLGLASMEERALASGGRLEVRSVLGQGTAVVFQLPLAQQSA